MPVVHQPTPQIVTRPPVTVVQVQQQQISPNTPALNEDDSNCCVATMNKSPLKTGTVYMSGSLIISYYMLYFNGINKCTFNTRSITFCICKDGTQQTTMDHKIEE